MALVSAGTELVSQREKKSAAMFLQSHKPFIKHSSLSMLLVQISERINQITMNQKDKLLASWIAQTNLIDQKIQELF